MIGWFSAAVIGAIRSSLFRCAVPSAVRCRTVLLLLCFLIVGIHASGISIPLSYDAISVKSGMSSRLVIEKSIAMVEFIDWWLKTSIAVIEIIDWWLKMTIAVVEIIDCWFRIMVAMVQKTIEYQDWRLLWSRKRLVSETDYTEIDDPERLPLWSRMERPGNKRGIVHVF